MKKEPGSTDYTSPVEVLSVCRAPLNLLIESNPITNVSKSVQRHLLPTIFNCLLFGFGIYFFRYPAAECLPSGGNGLSDMRMSSSPTTTEISFPHFGHSRSTIVPLSARPNFLPHLLHMMYFIILCLLTFLPFLSLCVISGASIPLQLRP